MDLIKLFLLVARRWYVVVPLLILGTAASLLVVRGISPEYSATGLMVVVDQSAAGQISAGALAEATQDGETQAQVTRGKPGSSYRITASQDGILRVQADADKAGDAVAVINAVLKTFAPTAERLSAGAQIEILNRPTAARLGPDGYEAEGAARLLGVGDEGAGFTGRTSSSLLSQLLSDGAVYSAAVVGDTTYEVTTSRDLPTISILATGTSERAVIATVRNVVAAADGQLDELARLTDSAASNTAARPVSLPTQATEETKGIFRSLVALLALTAAIAIAAALAIESLAEAKTAQHRPRIQPVLGGSGGGQGRAHRRVGASGTDGRSG